MYYTTNDEVISTSPDAVDANNANERIFVFSEYQHCEDNHPVKREKNWSEIVEMLEQRDYRKEKIGPAFGGAYFPIEVLRKGGNNREEVEDPENKRPEAMRDPLRWIEYATAASILVFEADEISESEFDFLIESFENLGCAGYIYSTHTHSEENIKLRFVIPMLNDIPKNRYAEIWARGNKFFKDDKQIFDTTAKDIVRLQYKPSCPIENKNLVYSREFKGGFYNFEDFPKLTEEESKKLNDVEEVEIDDNFEHITNEDFIKYSVNVVKKMMRDAQQGERNTMLFKCSAILGGYPILNFDTIESILVEVMSNEGFDYDERKERQTIKNGFAAGRKKPHCAKTNEFYLRWVEENKMNEQKQFNNIPAPKGEDKKGNLVYTKYQILKLLKPGWDCEILISHKAHAERLVENLGSDLRYCPSLSFLNFNEKTWDRDDKSFSETTAKTGSLSKKIREESLTLYDIENRLRKEGRDLDAKAMREFADSHMTNVNKAEDADFIRNTLKLTAGHKKIKEEAKTFNIKPWVLGFENGVWDKGVWREHKKEDYFIDVCPVEFKADYDQNDWKKVLNAMTDGDEKLAQTLQDTIGYILSGASHLRFLPWLYGPKGTGKSTLAELIQTLLGEMGATIDPSKLSGKESRERFGAQIWNKRLAVCPESGNNKTDAEMLKTYSGSDRITVRFLFLEQFTADPTHVLLMVSNDAPRLDAYDDALKDRIIALPLVHAPK